jgi:cobalt-zinc-cadmium efflux system membrane fusion protein
LLAPHGQAPTASEAPDAVGAAAVRPDGLLLVAPAKARALGIVTAPAQPASEVPLADLPVTIAPPPNARVAVAATLPGTVLRTLVVEGDSVSRGQALAVVASRDVMTLRPIWRAPMPAPGSPGRARRASTSFRARESSPGPAPTRPAPLPPKPGPMSPRNRASSASSAATGAGAPTRSPPPSRAA